MNNCEIITWNDGIKLLNDFKIDFDCPDKVILIDSCTEVFIFNNLPKKTLLISKYPKSGYSRNEFPAFIFDNSDIAEKCLKSGELPIPNKFLDILYKEKAYFVSTKDVIKHYKKYLETKYSLVLTLIPSFDELKKIFETIKPHKNNSEFTLDAFALSVLVSSYLANKYSLDLFIERQCTGYASLSNLGLKLNNDNKLFVRDYLTYEQFDLTFDDVYQEIEDRIDFKRLDKIFSVQQ